MWVFDTNEVRVFPKCAFSDTNDLRDFPKSRFPIQKIQKLQNKLQKSYKHRKTTQNLRKTTFCDNTERPPRQRYKTRTRNHRPPINVTERGYETAGHQSPSPVSRSLLLPGRTVLPAQSRCNDLTEGSTAAPSENGRPPRDHDGHRARTQATPVQNHEQSQHTRSCVSDHVRQVTHKLKDEYGFFF